MKQKLTELFINHLGVLEEQFSLHVFKHIDISEVEWVRNPFVASSLD
jgi:hypothetical protein